MTNHQIQPTLETPVTEVARHIFAELYQAVISEQEGVLRRDVEAVHDMRVASRRLRVALSNFAACCQGDERRRMRRSLGHLADALGSVRDLDVLVAALKKYQAGLEPDEQKHIAALIRRLRARRLRRCRRLEAFLQSEDYATFKREFLSVLQINRGAEHLTEHQETYGQSFQSEETVAAR
jgi:CHAD domain-containing protein